MLKTALSVLSLALSMPHSNSRATEPHLPITFSGGHETDPRDHGRPVVLIAAALNVTPEQFREAFSDVTPARGRGPKPTEARRNKQALLRVLGPLKVTNDRLDEVSDYYRYRPEKGELWTNEPAEAYAVVDDGVITKIIITNPGSGYSSPPNASVKGLNSTRLETTIKFDRNLEKNGRVVAVEFAAKK